MFILLGSVPLHRLPTLLDEAGLTAARDAIAASQGVHIIASASMLAAPGALAWLIDRGARLGGAGDAWGKPRKPFLELAYGYLPLVWAGILSYYLFLMLGEGGHILALAGHAVGAPLPSFEAHPAVIRFLQGATLFLGTSSSLVLTRRIGGEWRAVTHQCACILGAGAGLYHVVETM